MLNILSLTCGLNQIWVPNMELIKLFFNDFKRFLNEQCSALHHLQIAAIVSNHTFLFLLLSSTLQFLPLYFFFYVRQRDISSERLSFHFRGQWFQLDQTFLVNKDKIGAIILLIFLLFKISNTIDLWSLFLWTPLFS